MTYVTDLNVPRSELTQEQKWAISQSHRRKLPPLAQTLASIRTWNTEFCRTAMRTKEEIESLKQTVEETWTSLEVNAERKRRDQNRVSKIAKQYGKLSAELLKEWQNQVKGLDTLRSQRMEIQVREVRTQLRQLWDSMHMPHSERTQFAPAFNAEFNEPALAAHKAELVRLQGIHATMVPLLKLVIDLDSTRLKIEAVEKKAKDPNRFHKRATYILLKEEEKAHAMKDRLPEFEQNLLDQILAWEVHQGREFIYQSRPIAKEIRKRQEDAARKREEAKKKGHAHANCCTPTRSGHHGGVHLTPRKHSSTCKSRRGPASSGKKPSSAHSRRSISVLNRTSSAHKRHPMNHPSSRVTPTRERKFTTKGPHTSLRKRRSSMMVAPPVPLVIDDEEDEENNSAAPNSPSPRRRAPPIGAVEQVIKDITEMMNIGFNGTELAYKIQNDVDVHHQNEAKAAKQAAADLNVSLGSELDISDIFNSVRQTSPRIKRATRGRHSRSSSGAFSSPSRNSRLSRGHSRSQSLSEAELAELGGDVEQRAARVRRESTGDEVIITLRMKKNQQSKQLADIVKERDDYDDSDSDSSSSSDSSDSSDSEDDLPAIIIDHGAHRLRVGIQNDEFLPTFVENTALTIPRPHQDAKWEELSEYWKSTLSKLGAKNLEKDLSKRNILIVKNQYHTQQQQNKLEEMIIKEWKARGVHVSESPQLVAYSYGMFTALVVDIGHTSARVVPIIDGVVVTSAIQTARYLGGERMTQHFHSLLQMSESLILDGIHSPAKAADLVNFIKENYAFCVLEYDASLKNEQLAMDIELPARGGTFSLHQELFDCGEMLFQPGLILNDADMKSLPELMFKAISGVSMENRQELLQCICPAGGVSMMPGMLERLEKEMRLLYPNLAKSIKVKRDDNRRYASWSGGAVVSQLPEFTKSWKTYPDLL